MKRSWCWCCVWILTQETSRWPTSTATRRRWRLLKPGRHQSACQPATHRTAAGPRTVPSHGWVVCLAAGLVLSGSIWFYLDRSDSVWLCLIPTGFVLLVSRHFCNYVQVITCIVCDQEVALKATELVQGLSDLAKQSKMNSSIRTQTGRVKWTGLGLFINFKKW